MLYRGQPGRGQGAPLRASQRWLAGLAAVLTVLLHGAVLLALVRGFEVSPALQFKRLAPVQVSLLRSAPIAMPPPASPVVAKPVLTRPVAARAAPRADASAPPAPEAREHSTAPDSGAAVSAQFSAEVSADAAPAPDGEASQASTSLSPPLDALTAESALLARAVTPAEVASAQNGAQLPLYGVPLGAPIPGRSRFQVYYGDYVENRQIALMEYTVETDGERYELRSEGRAQGLTALFYSGVLSQRSVGRIGVNGLLPERFVEQRGKRPERLTSIDYPAAQAFFSGGQQVPWQPGTQDRLSVLMQLSLIGRAEPQRLAAGQVLSIPELGSRTIEPARFRSLGDEALETPDGVLRTIRLTRQDGNPLRDPVIDIWLGYDHGLMPVRIRLTDVGGRVLDQLLMR